MLQSLTGSDDWQDDIARGIASLPEATAEELGVSAQALLERGEGLLMEAGRAEAVIERSAVDSVLQIGLDVADYPYYLSFTLPHNQTSASLDSRGSVWFSKGGFLHLDHEWNLVPFPERLSLRFDGADLQVKGHPVASRVISRTLSSTSELIIFLRSRPDFRALGDVSSGEATIQGEFEWQGVRLAANQPVAVGFGLTSSLESHLPEALFTAAR
jgi:hypothetical protein